MSWRFWLWVGFGVLDENCICITNGYEMITIEYVLTSLSEYIN